MKIMKLAINKRPDYIPTAGFHYMLHPMAMRDEQEANIFGVMGYIIIEVPENKGDQLLRSARLALAHQVEIAVFADAVEKLAAKKP